MSREYTVAEYKAWTDENGVPATDSYGNVMGTVIFEEQRNEPIDIRHKADKNPFAAGSKITGDIEPYQTKSGKTRLKFKREQQQKPQGSPQDSRKTYGKSPEESAQIAYLSHEKNATELVRVNLDSDIYETAQLVAAVTQILFEERERYFKGEKELIEQMTVAQEVVETRKVIKNDIPEDATPETVLEDVDEPIDLSGIPF